ncbi:conserved protein, unknown function [Hepatocystis sp. ex Piliocolobus tephrosceles]|nr:conserved protein, unknown function [Hepatocystis sp. ex Piliocolobus tephrosceles]
MNDRKIKKVVWYITLFYLLLYKLTLLLLCKQSNKSLKFIYTCPFITPLKKDLVIKKSINRYLYEFKNGCRSGNKVMDKRQNNIYTDILNYNIYMPINWFPLNVNKDEHSIKINNFLLTDYNIISIDYGYKFMGFCILCKNEYIYESIKSKHKNLICNKNFDIPIKKNLIMFYTVYYNGYIKNIYFFFQHLFKFIYNTNILVIIGCNGLHMNKLASDMGRYMCYFMNKVNGLREEICNDGGTFYVKDELIILKNDNIFKEKHLNYLEKYNFYSNENKTFTVVNKIEGLHFFLQNVVTKVKDKNNTLFSKFYNKTYKNRKDSLSACYLLYYFLKYYDHNQNYFLLPSKNINYVYHMKK